MKIAKTIFNIAALVIAFTLFMKFEGNAQTVTYTAKNTATATGNVGTVPLTDVSNDGVIARDEYDQTPITFPMIGASKTVATPVLQTDGTYRITYTIIAQNFGATPLASVQVTDDFGSNPFTKFSVPSYSYVSVSNTANTGIQFNGTTVKTLMGNSVAGKNIVAPGGSITITLTVSVPAGTYGTYNNSVTATGIDPDGNTVTDISTNNASPNHANGTKTPLDFDDPTPVTLLAPDIKITKTVDKLTPKVGENVTFTVTAANIGAADAAPVTVTDLLPAGFTFVSATPGAGTYNSTTGVWSVGTIAASGQQTLTIVATVLPNKTITEYTNIATNTQPGDTDPSNNSATVVVAPIPQADLQVTNTDGKTTYTPGTSNTYTVVVTNNGPSDAPGSTITYPFPTGVTGTWTAVYANGATGTASGTGAINETASIPSGGTVTYTITANVASNVTAAPLATTATVAVASGIVDPTPGNNTATDNDTFTPQADLAVTNTDGTPTYAPGTTSTYTVVASNNGPSDAPGSTVTYPFPTGVTGSWTATYAGGATGTANGTGAISETANIPSGGTITYTITANVASNVTANPLSTTATVAVPTGYVDPTPANNTATDNDTFAPQADLSVTNTDGKTTYTPGTSNTYTVVVTNNGPSDAPGSTISYPFPTGVTGTWTATYAGGAIGTASGTGAISETANIPSGGSITYTITANVASNVTANPLSTTATVAVPTGYVDPTPANNSATDNDTFEPQADLSVTNTDGKTTYTPGASNTYTVTVTNGGPSDAPGSTVTYPFPTGVTGTWTATYAGGATGTASGTGAISETANIPSGGSITYTITANVASNVTANPLSTTATVAVPTGYVDPTPTNNTATDNDTFAPQADLSVTNTDGKTNYTPGTSNTYTVTVTNAGPSNAPGSTISYPFPTGVTGTWAAVYAGGATGTASGTGAISETANIPSGGTITYTITANVASNVSAAPLATTATVTVPTGYVDPTPANNTATDNDTFTPQADLQVTNTDGKTTYTPGTSNTYTVVVTNAGPSNAPGSTISYSFPTGVTGTWAAVYAGGATGTASGTGAISETANIPSGGTITYTITANVASNVTAAPLATTATVAVATGYTDPTPANNTATDNDTFTPQADLAITNTDGTPTYTPGTTTTYTVVATNTGPTDAPGSTVTNPLPAGTTGTWTAVYTGGATGNTSGTGGINETVDIPKNGTITYTITVTVPSSATGNLVSAATVAVPTGYTDPTPANNVATDTDTRNPIADLSITNTDGKTTYTPGTTNTYTVVVNNAGPTDAPGSTVTNTLPAGVTGTWTAVYAGGATGNASGTNSIAETVNIPKGGTITYTYIVTIPSNVTGSFTNTATVAIPTGFTDPTPANNTATDVDAINSIADLNITNTDGTPTYTPGTTTTYTVVATNTGPTDAPGSTVTNPLPTGTTGTWTAVYAGGATGNTSGTGGINETVNIPKNGTITYTITVTVPSSQTGNITSTATVAVPTGYTDPTPANNTATDVDTQNSIADMSVTKTSNNLTPLVGDNVTFTITALNSGPSDASGVKVTDLLKAGYSFVSATATKGSYVNGTGIWTIGSMVNGSSAVLTVIAKVTADIPTPGYDNAAVVSATETDPNLVNNTSTITTVPVSLIDLAIIQTVSSTIPDATGNVTFTLTVNNNGPSNATGVSVADLLKPGFNFVSANSAQGTYNPSTGTWAIGNLANGGTTTMTLTVKVNNTGTQVTDYTNTAVVSATQQEVTLVNNTSAQTVSKPPTATDNNATTTLNIPVTIPIMADDIKGSSNLDPASIVIIQQPAHGTLTLDPATGRVLYTPATNYYGTDVFTYTVKGTDGSVSNVATVNITINDNPRIGIAKAATLVEKAVNGSFNVTYLLTVGNYGIIDLNNVSVKDDLAATFRGEQIKVVNIKSLGTLTVNTAYDGNFITELLATGNTLAPGISQQIQVTVNVALQSAGGITYNNTATASGKSVSGVVTTDASTDGLKPDPNVSGDVNPSTPTPVVLTKPKEFIPGGFSPNGDGVNDKFVIENSGSKHIDVEIYNRWGNLVYKNNNYQNDWDGRSNQGVRIGDQLPEGTYFYVVKVDYKDRYAGYLTLKR